MGSLGQSLILLLLLAGREGRARERGERWRGGGETETERDTDRQTDSDREGDRDRARDRDKGREGE